MPASPPDAWAPVLAACAAGDISPEIALARLLLSGDAPDPALLAQEAAARPALAPLAALATARADALGHLAALARTIDPAGDDPLAATAATFDRLAAEAPEAGVAFYSLGDPALLARATDELAQVVRAWAPVAGKAVLDLGCGIGRLALALAPDARAVIGLDVSPGMVAEARRRAAATPNLRFLAGSGRDLAPLADASLDLIVAADSFPYLVRAGLLEAHLAEAGRVLRPGGDLLVFNWSYRGDPARDLAEAHGSGLAVVRAGERPFALWDATGFHLRRP